IAGIVDVLEIERCEQSAPEVRCIEALNDFFVAVSETPVAKQKALAAEREILLMGRHDSIHHKGGSYAVVPPVPRIALREGAKLECAVIFGIRERLVAAIAPSQAAKDTHLGGNLLLKVQAEP